MTDRVILRKVDGTTFAAMQNGELGFIDGAGLLVLGGFHGTPSLVSDANVTVEAAARVAADAAEASTRAAADTAEASARAAADTAISASIPTADGTTIVNTAGVLSATPPLSTPVTKTGTSGSVSTTDTALVLNPSSTYTLTLPSPGTTPGRVIRLKLIANQIVNSASSNVVPLTSATPGTAIFPATSGKWCVLHSDGSNWITMAGN